MCKGVKEEIKYSIEIEKINKNSILQYILIKKIFCLIVPYDDEITKTYYKNETCIIDIGIQTFLTTYSPERSYEILNFFVAVFKEYMFLINLLHSYLLH